MTGKTNSYQLPPVKEWNQGDKVSIKIEIGNEKLAKCNCIIIIDSLEADNQCEEESCSNNSLIVFDIPKKLAGERGTIMITVSDGIDHSTYFLGIVTKEFAELESEVYFPESQTAVTQQPMLRKVIDAETIDFEAEV